MNATDPRVTALIDAARSLLVDAIDRGDCYATEHTWGPDGDGYAKGQMFADYRALAQALADLGAVPPEYAADRD